MEDAHLHAVRGTTRWLVYEGTISLEGIRCLPLAIEAAVWLGALLASIVALTLICRTTLRSPAISYVLVAGALVIGYLGLLTPFSFWPRIFYCQTDGDYQFAFELNRLFAAPLAFGAMALVATISGNVICPTCQKAAIPFRQIWLKSTRHARCPRCGARCRLRHPVGFALIGLIPAILVLALGYIVAGYVGFLTLVPVALGANAWLGYYAIRSFGWLRASEE